MLKCGIVGFGYMGAIRKKVIESHSELELIGICEVNKEKSEEIIDTPVFSSFEELLSQNPDVVFVCTPNCYSPEISIECLNRGIHVFCEKPPGRNVQDIISMKNAENSNTKLMFGFNHRYHPGIIKAKVLVDSGRLGKVLSLRGLYGKSGGANYKKSWRNDKAISGGGILLDQGIHMLDLFRYFCDDFEDVKCFRNDVYWKVGMEDNAFVILQNKKGQSASLHSCATLWKHTFRIDLILEDGYMYVEGLLSQSGSYGREKLVVAKRQFENETDAVGNPSEEVTYFDRDDSWNFEVDEFVNCIKEDKPVVMSSSNDALRVMQIVEQAYKDSTFSGNLSEEKDEKHCHL